jgi:hypothetical protein
MTKLNWKQQSSGRYRALASRAVGGVYFIDYTESFYGSYHHSRGFWVRSYTIEHDNSNHLSLVPYRTLEIAKAVAEFHHQKACECDDRYRISDEVWSEIHAFAERLSADMRAEIEEKRRQLNAGWEGEPGGSRDYSL